MPASAVKKHVFKNDIFEREFFEKKFIDFAPGIYCVTITDEFAIIIPLNKSRVCQTLFIIVIKHHEKLEIVLDFMTNLGLCCKDKNLMQRINKTNNMPRLSNYCSMETQ